MIGADSRGLRPAVSISVRPADGSIRPAIAAGESTTSSGIPIRSANVLICSIPPTR
jgi:hypothetical protein